MAPTDRLVGVSQGLRAMKDPKVPLVLYGENPLALRYLKGRLRPERASILPFPYDGRITGNHPSGFVLIADQGCHDISKQRVLHLVRHISQRAKTLVIGHSTPTRYLREMILHGVHGFIAYSDLEAELAPALKALRSGRLWMPVTGDEAEAPPTENGAAQRFPYCQPLTAREQIVVHLLRRHLSNKEIGNHLNISERTVKFHVSNIFEKLNVRDRHSAVSLAETFANPIATASQKPLHCNVTVGGLVVVTDDTNDGAQPFAAAAKAGQS